MLTYCLFYPLHVIHMYLCAGVSHRRYLQIYKLTVCVTATCGELTGSAVFGCEARCINKHEPGFTWIFASSLLQCCYVRENEGLSMYSFPVEEFNSLWYGWGRVGHQVGVERGHSFCRFGQWGAPGLLCTHMMPCNNLHCKILSVDLTHVIGTVILAHSSLWLQQSMITD